MSGHKFERLGGNVGPAVCATCGLTRDAQVHRRKAGVKVRGYSRDFTPKADNGRKITVDKIPAALYVKVIARTKRDGVSVRATILRLLEGWVAS